jgi:hypothetical protein
MKKNKGLLSFVVFAIVLVFASLACGVADIPNPFATDTPTPTLTFTPSPTSTPSPTPTSTPTNTPTATPRPTGVATESLSNGKNLFIDYDNKYQLTLSDEWVIIPIDKADLDAMLTKLSKENPDLAKSAEAFKNLDANVVRMVALNSNRDYLSNGNATNINITALSNPMLATMPISFITGALEESFTKQGMKVLTTGVNIIDNTQGLDVEYIDIEQSLKGAKIQQRIILFQSNEKLIMITISTMPQFKDKIFQVAEEIGTSIELFK